MAACEKCWGEAYLRSVLTGRNQLNCYLDILCEVDASGILCTPQEQAGVFWDYERGVCMRKATKERPA
jgi:hypothetical protein